MYPNLRQPTRFLHLERQSARTSEWTRRRSDLGELARSERTGT